MMMQAVANKLLDDLILARLLVVGKRPIGPAKLRADLTPLLESPPTEEMWPTILQDLEEAGLLTRKPLALTDAGRTRAGAFLGLHTQPPPTDWHVVQTDYLLPKALRGSTDRLAALEQLKKADQVRAAVLCKAYDLPIPETATASEAVEALACQQVCERMGLEPQRSFDAIKNAVLNRLIQSPTPLAGRPLIEHLAAHALGVTGGGMQELREAILRRWLEADETAATVDSSPSPAAPPENHVVVEPRSETQRSMELDPATFAATVQAVARACSTGHSDGKVFINHVWRQLQHEPNFPSLDLLAFKDRLVDAAQRGLLKLKRADHVEAMNLDDVRESETTLHNEPVHFIPLEAHGEQHRDTAGDHSAAVAASPGAEGR